MKRHGNLWEEIINFDNLLSAAKKAQKGKRFRDNVLAFNYKLELELEKIQTSLESKTYIPGTYKTLALHKCGMNQLNTGISLYFK